MRASNLKVMVWRGWPSGPICQKLVRTIAWTRLTKRRRMRSSSSEATFSSASSMSATSAASRAARSGRRRHEARVEAGLEQGDDAADDVEVVDQRRPHIVLAERRARLAQVARQGPHHRHLAPAHPAAQDQGVVAVRFGASAQHRHERGLEPLLEIGVDGDRPPVGGLQRHVVQPDGRRRRPRARRDAVGALVDDAEAVILDHRHAVGQRQRRALGEDLQVEAVRLLAVAAIDVDGRARSAVSAR